MILFILIVAGLVAYVAAGSALGKRLKRNASQYPKVVTPPAIETLDVALNCGHVLRSLPMIPLGETAPESVFCVRCGRNHPVIRIVLSSENEVF